MRATNLRQDRGSKSSASAQKRSSTKDLLIDTGELLYGQHGFNGISLREIASRAGQGNCNAVQYHFGSKFGFVSAILADRVSRLDTLRAERFDELKQVSKKKNYDPRDLMKLLWLPDLSIVGPNKIHTYIRFSLQYYLQPDAGEHPFYTRDIETGRGNITEKGERSCLFQVNDLLRKHFRKIRSDTFSRRITALSMMYQCSVVEYDNEQVLGNRSQRPSYDPEPIIDMALGALSAPD